MKNTTPTVYGDFIQACSFTGAPFDMVANTTLNERLGILAGVAPPTGKVPQAGWICIGNQGHRPVVDGLNSWNTGRQHLPSHGGPFEMMPFVLRPINNDLTQAERKKYGLRKIEEYGGKQYIAYYLKKVDMTTSRPAMVIIDKTGGVTSFRPFVPTTSDLSPTPTDLAPEETQTANGNQLGVRQVITVILTAAEIEMVLDACRIMYDNASRAVLSEIGMVAGVEYVTNGTSTGGGVVEYTEVISAQVVSHLITHYSLPFVNNQVREDMVLGTSNPLMGGTS